MSLLLELRRPSVRIGSAVAGVARMDAVMGVHLDACAKVGSIDALDLMADLAGIGRA
ncbi:hypothetical protein [Massilia suwonensis]|uniref:Uncharacterized protein n=1 Tax=Massilia suwonensis TaxID=648895 RepID=A0ABW0MJI0_9BURK